MKRIKADVLVIGAGSGGLSVAAGAAQMGVRVVLLEGGEMGGDCLNTGCVPSKALIAAAHVAHDQRHADRFGIGASDPQVDYAAVQDHVAEVIAQIAPNDSQDRFESLGVQVIRAYGRFVSKRRVQAGDYMIKARRIVIATGSSPMVPPIPGLSDVPYLTNETLFQLRDKPQELLILGGGPIGMEMAQAHARLGCTVTVLEGARALGKDDPELAQIVVQTLRGEGVAIHEETMVSEVAQTGGRIEVTTKDGQRFSGTHLLVAAGRRANLDRLDPKAGGITITNGAVSVNAGLRSSNRRVYAIGDAVGGMQFTHVAGYHAGLVIRSMLFALRARVQHHHIPWVTYTAPELAQVGLTESAARAQHGPRLEIARFDIAHNDRAIAQRAAQGCIKVMVVRGRPVGASICGPGAGEQIALWSMAIGSRMKMSQIAAMIAPYPTLSDVSKRAAGAYFTPRLFDSPMVKRVVRLVQRVIF